MRLAILSCCALMASSCDAGGAVEPSQEQLAEAHRRWLAVSRCLVGAPLPEDVTASARLRYIELAIVAAGSDAGGWPGHCTAPAGELKGHLTSFKQDAAVDKYAGVVEALGELADTRPDMYAATDAPIVDRLWTAAREAGLEPVPAAIAEAAASGDGPEAPRSTTPLPVAELQKLGQSKGFIERRELAPDTDLRFILGDTDAGAFFCHLHSRKARLDEAACHPLAQSGIAATPLSAEKADDDVYWDSEPKPSAWRLGGASLEVPVSASGFVFAEGTIADVVAARPKSELVRLLKSGRTERAPVTPPPGGELLGFRGGAAVWRGPVRAASGQRPVTVQDVQAGRVGMGGAVEPGEVPKDVKHMMACRAGEDLRIVLIGDDPKQPAEERGAALLTRNKIRWRKPIALKIPFGKPADRWTENWWRHLSCDEQGATLTWLRDDRRVGRMRCDAERCEAALSEPIAAVAKNEKLRVVGLGDAVLVVRSIRGVAPLSGLSELVSMRIAPLDGIAEASDRVLLGDDKYGGLPDLHKSLGLLASGDAAVALIHSGADVYGLRIAANGEVSKLALAKPPAP